MPATLRTAIGLLAVQVLAGAALAVFLGYLEITSTASSRALGLYVTIFCALYTAAFAFTMSALIKRKLAARGVAIALELLLLAPAYYMITGGTPLLGWIIAGVCGAVVITLLAPQTTQVLS